MCHACGHDCHAAILLATAEALAKMRELSVANPCLSLPLSIFRPGRPSGQWS